jgi:hypothetical protein
MLHSSTLRIIRGPSLGRSSGTGSTQSWVTAKWRWNSGCDSSKCGRRHRWSYCSHVLCYRRGVYEFHSPSVSPGGGPHRPRNVPGACCPISGRSSAAGLFGVGSWHAGELLAGDTPRTEKACSTRHRSRFESSRPCGSQHGNVAIPGVVLDFEPDRSSGLLLLWGQVGARTTTMTPAQDFFQDYGNHSH